MADPPLLGLISRLEDEIQDPDEETFLLYANDIPSQGLGFIDSHASVLDLQLNGRDITIHQSPGVLASSRKGGTTGSVLWKITPAFAEWLASPTNILFNTILTPSCSVIELGCGISPLNALSLSQKVSRYILTDQPYVQKLVLQNLTENKVSSPATKGGKSKKAGSSHKSPSPPSHTAADIHFQVLDWETSQVSPSLTNSPSASSFDALIACDCVFNYALIQPFVQTCADICKLRQSDNLREGDKLPPCLCIVAQQLRNDDVFNSWLVAFKEHFRVWRIPGEMMPATLRPEAGFVVHIGIFKDSL
ncbi:uncharacterized protein TrAFT101_001224 [Trichoderma asperellum]|uniref:Diaminohydroxyphosphoribosylamino-pyrimidine deaminase n=1 Tax=Trichoderma asperellum (strain ATCC 204424 / CBS 433.97 / NBRC 101777) TaxID=1042311 RepID=A0A2T3ZLX2_TRIA4|nr:hypothetical protein M441DRAFT_131406 [Trichoderma asperellum CBS 433.97]PTB45792.1 hypothetical protein M441DRAFT_131406 [Trichoderma asperellum CBS 433.97]UKZ85360.1 hypothetical protein TrAFT101_001224 [Trichoderma asperellum]